MIEKNIWMFWTNNNPLTENRIYGLKSAKENIIGCTIKFLDKSQIEKHLIPGYPLHKGYNFLSENHKSDYLRSYFMNFYGGGYADIKPYTKDNNWSQCFDIMNNDPKIQVIGTPESLEWATFTLKNTIYKTADIKQQVAKLLCNGWFICRPHTKFTEEWYKRVQQKMDERYNDLKLHPAIDIFGKTGNYPLRWGEMQGEIFHQLLLDYYDPAIIKPILKHGRDSSKKYR